MKLKKKIKETKFLGKIYLPHKPILLARFIWKKKKLLVGNFRNKLWCGKWIGCLWETHKLLDSSTCFIQEQTENKGCLNMMRRFGWVN